MIAALANDLKMILLDDVVQVLAGARFDMSPSVVLHAKFPQCRAAGSVPAEGDGTREAMAVRGQCFAKERLWGRAAAVLTQHEIDGLTILIDRAILGSAIFHGRTTL